MSEGHALHALVAQAARGAPSPWPAEASLDLAERVLSYAQEQRVDGLIAAVGDAALAERGWPATLRSALRDGARELALRETVRGEALRRLLAAWQRAGVASLVFKGTAYASRMYTAPHLRGGADHDLWVQRGARARAERVLEAFGYERGPRIRGELLETQVPYANDVAGVRHVVDLHWEVSNRRSLADAFPFADAWARSQPLPELGPGVRCVDAVDALLLACIHGPGHHRDQATPLVWHLDVHQLATSLDAPAWREVVERSQSRRWCALVRLGLVQAQAHFETPVPSDVLGDLGAAEGEASARLLRAPLGLLAEDVRATRGAARRLRLLREAAFPDTAFLEARYGPHPSQLRPFLWVRRWLEAAARRVPGLRAPADGAVAQRAGLDLLASHLRPQLPLLVAGAAATALQAAALLALPVRAGRLTEAWSAGHAGGVLLTALPVALAGLYVLSGVLARLALGRATLRLASALRQSLAGRLQTLPRRWLERHPSGTLLSWLSAESETLAATTTELPAMLVPTAGAALVAALLLAARDPWIAVGALAVAPLAALAVRAAVRSLHEISSRAVDAHAALLALLQEQIEGLTTIRLCVREEREAERLRVAEERLADARSAQLSRQLWLGPVAQLVTLGTVLAAIAVAALRPDATPRSPAEWVTTLLYGLAMARLLASLVVLPAQWVGARASLERFTRAWRAVPEPREAEPCDPPAGALEWHDVHFRHAGRRPVLLGASLRVAPGEIVALVGANGTGKTSLAGLAVRLDYPDAGRVSIGGRDLHSLDPRAVRRAVVLVSQKTRLFDLSLRENLAFGAPDATASEIEEASRRAGLHDFIAGLPQGYDTRIGEDGVQLSAGQRQRVALARAIVREPRVLILDEATAMLDADGERCFLSDNRSWLRRRAVLLVTHRRSGFDLADRVATLVDGRIVEERATPPAPRDAHPTRVPTAARGGEAAEPLA